MVAAITYVMGDLDDADLRGAAPMVGTRRRAAVPGRDVGHPRGHGGLRRDALAGSPVRAGSVSWMTSRSSAASSLLLIHDGVAVKDGPRPLPPWAPWRPARDALRG